MELYVTSILSLMALSSLFLACETGSLEAEISPDEPGTQDDLALSLDDTTAEVTAISWTVNGKAQPDLDGAMVVPADQTEKGETWEATVEGPKARFSVSTSIRNSEPSAASAAITPESPGAADTLICAPEGFSDADNDPAAWQYQWLLNDQDAGDGPELGAELAVGDQVSCTAWPVDSDSSGDGVSAEVVIGNTAPTILVVTITPLAPSTENELSYEAEAEDIDGDAVTFTAQWQVNGDAVHSGPTLASTYFERDDEVSVTVSPADGDGGGPAVQVRTQIQNASPTLISMRMEPTDPDATDRVDAFADAIDPDGDSIRPQFSWWLDGEEIAEGPSLPAGLTQRGDALQLKVRISDGEFTEFGEMNVRVANAAPSAPGMGITPANGAVAGLDDLVCEMERASVDPDGNTVSYSILWTRDGMPYLGVQSDSVIAGDTVSADVIDEGDNWACLVNASDGAKTSYASASSTVLTCISSVEVFVATTTASVDPTDFSAIEGEGISASEGSQAWMLFDLSGLPERSFVSQASLALYTQADGVEGSPSVQVLASPAAGWTATSPAVGSAVEVSEHTSGLSSEEWTSMEVDVTAWNWTHALRNQATSLGIQTGERESEALFYDESESGKEPTLTLTMTLCE